LEKRKSEDRYRPKVYCPKCRARLMDICQSDLYYQAVLAGMGDKITWDFAMKCPKCNSMVGISFERAAPRLMYRRTDHTEVVKAYALPMPYHEVILSEPVGS